MSELTTLLPSDLNAGHCYYLMIGVLVPRPIAWVTSQSDGGLVNLAPFSFYAGICAQPPIVGLGINRRKDGSHKDTARNILQQKEFVVHLPERPQLNAVVGSSAEFPPEVSEPQALGLELETSQTVSVPGLRDARVRLECVLYKHLEVGVGPTDFLMGEVQAFRIAPDLLDDQGRLREDRLQAVGRLGGTGYAPVRERLEMARPPLP